LPLVSKPRCIHRTAATRARRQHRVLIRDVARNTCVFYAPGSARSTEVFDAMAGSDCVMVDGTFWRDDEMPIGVASKSARDIGPAAPARGGMISGCAPPPTHGAC
jgi:pyrroloquinoline quinone biosynthesis protein B